MKTSVIWTYNDFALIRCIIDNWFSI